jgi:hypothetical protein
MIMLQRLALPKSDESSKLRDTLNDLSAARTDSDRSTTAGAPL